MHTHISMLSFYVILTENFLESHGRRAAARKMVHAARGTSESITSVTANAESNDITRGSTNPDAPRTLSGMLCLILLNLVN